MVERDVLEAKALGATGTLTLFINGRRGNGVPPGPVITNLIKNLLAGGDGSGPAPVTAGTLDLSGAPIRGAADAPVTIVEFSDFQCGFCFRVNPTLAQLLDRYQGKVRVVFKHSPIEGHTAAPLAHRAAFAAQQQGKFWEMHDRIFANQRAMDGRRCSRTRPRSASTSPASPPISTARAPRPCSTATRPRPPRSASTARRRSSSTARRWSGRSRSRRSPPPSTRPWPPPPPAESAAANPVKSRPMLQAWRWATFLLLLLTAAPAAADPRLPAIFSDHMVLQQQMPIGVWGWAAPDERIEVRLRAQRVSTTADRDGRWRVTLAPEARAARTSSSSPARP